MKIEIYTIGTGVIISPNDIEGIITRVVFTGEKMSVLYTVEWWDGLTLNSSDFFPSQVKAKNGDSRLQIGFAPNHSVQRTAGDSAHS